MDFATLAAQLNAGTILPEGIVIITLLVVLVGDLIVGRSSSGWTPYVAVAGLLAAVAALCLQWDNVDTISFLGGFNS
ncbi:NAD(P)H-quinone oxidoreductase subunit 2, partial [Microcoleus sp. HI-ES]|nr:NAD(P)H-quinone oxidoreductase subunit 2 [Microcoleus sp. HI-ES]